MAQKIKFCNYWPPFFSEPYFEELFLPVQLKSLWFKITLDAIDFQGMDKRTKTVFQKIFSNEVSSTSIFQPCFLKVLRYVSVIFLEMYKNQFFNNVILIWISLKIHNTITISHHGKYSLHQTVLFKVVLLNITVSYKDGTYLNLLKSSQDMLPTFSIHYI